MKWNAQLLYGAVGKFFQRQDNAKIILRKDKEGCECFGKPTCQILDIYESFSFADLLLEYYIA